MFGGNVPPTPTPTPMDDTLLMDQNTGGGVSGKRKDEEEGERIRKMLQRDDEEIIFIAGTWILKNNN